MREVTKTTKVYTIRELSEGAQERAIEKHRDINTFDSFWYESLYEDYLPEQARAKGFELKTQRVPLMNGEYRSKPVVYFSGFWSQGDGASFECYVDYEEFILKNRLGNRYRMLLNHARRGGGSLSISVSGHYVHSGAMHIDDYDHHFNASDDTQRAWDAAEKADEQAEELADEILDAARDLADEFYRTLQKEYDYLNSDEQIIESIDINGYEFEEDGSDYDS